MRLSYKLSCLVVHCRPFFLFKHFFNPSLSDLTWKTEKFRPEDLRGGAFSIRQWAAICTWISSDDPVNGLNPILGSSRSESLDPK